MPRLKMKLATILRRMADRLAPAPIGDCQSSTTWLNYAVDVPAGVTSIRPYISSGSFGNTVTFTLGDEAVGE